MRESKFQFNNPVVMEVVFEINEYFDSESDFTLENEFTSKVIEDGENSRAMVELELEVHASTNNPFYLKIRQGCEFTWEQADFSDDDIKQLLSINAPTILLSYMRPIVSMITAASPLPAFNLPFVDFSDNISDK